MCMQEVNEKRAKTLGLHGRAVRWNDTGTKAWVMKIWPVSRGRPSSASMYQFDDASVMA